jgi:hypothetical protein
MKKFLGWIMAGAVAVTLSGSAFAHGGGGGGGGGGHGGGGGGHFGGGGGHFYGGHGGFGYYPYYYGFGWPYYYGYGYGYPYGYGYGYGYPYGYGYGYGANRGNSGNSVAELQRTLAKMGYYRGPIDGIVGPQTRAAMHAFEREGGVAATGGRYQSWAARPDK